MKTTKTSEAIAARMRKRGYIKQQVFWFLGGYRVDVYHLDPLDCVGFLGATAKTITAAYREVERQWEKEQADDTR